MTTLADDIKRLRGLSELTEQMTEQSIFRSVRQLNMHPKEGVNDVITLSDGLLDAIRTINALVDLVGEMSNHFVSINNRIVTSRQMFHVNNITMDIIYNALPIEAITIKALTKTAPIANLSRSCQ